MRNIVRILIILATVFWSLFKTGYCRDWHIEVVDSIVHLSFPAQAILDLSENPHLFLFNNTTHNLIHYQKTGPQWYSTEYDYYFIPQSVCIDSRGTFHLSSAVSSQNIIYYLSIDSSLIILDTIYVDNGLFVSSSIAVDQDDNVNIITGNYLTGQIYRIQKIDDYWAINQIFDLPSYIGDISLRIGVDGIIHFAIAWSDTPKWLVYANNYPDWNYIVLASNSYGNAILELNNQSRPSILYNYDRGDGDLRQSLFEFSGESWDTTSFDTSYTVNNEIPLTYDSSGNPHSIVIGEGGPAPGDEAGVHISRNTGRWIVDTLVVGGYSQFRIMADSYSRLHVFYSRRSGIGLYYGWSFVEMGVENGPISLIGNYSLSAYPNPFNSATTITLTGTDQAELAIYDITGRLITTLRTLGGQAVWDASAYSSGLYFARVAGEKATTIKLVLVK